MWPMRHAHPLADFPREPKPGPLPEARGLIEIASGAGIKIAGLTGQGKAPPIKTVDLAVTRAVDRRVTLVMIAVEPEPEDGEDAAADAEWQLKLQRLYAQETQASFAIVGRRVLGEYFGPNLEGFAGAAVLPPDLADEVRLREFAACVSENSVANSLQEAVVTLVSPISIAADSCSARRAISWRSVSARKCVSRSVIRTCARCSSTV